MSAVFLDFATVGAEELDLARIESALPGLEVFDTTPASEVGARIRDAEFVLLNKVRMTRELLANAPALKFIGLTATGYDNIDIEAAREHGIAVCNIRAYCTGSVVEHVFGALLMLTHSLPQFRDSVADGAWQRADSFCLLDHPIRELSAMTVGIVGYGELGRGVAERAAAFGMRVLIAQRPGSNERRSGRVPLDDLLREADVVSLHCPLTEQTAGLLGEQEFAQMKDDAILVNTARGGLVDSAALVAALEAGRLGGAVIDVLPQEPPVDGNPLLDCRHPRLIVTPHIAWGTREARQAALDQLADCVSAFRKGEQLNRVD